MSTRSWQLGVLALGALARIDARHRCRVGARIEVDTQLWFTSDTHNGVLTQGGPTEAEVVVRRVPGS